MVIYIDFRRRKRKGRVGKLSRDNFLSRCQIDSRGGCEQIPILFQGNLLCLRQSERFRLPWDFTIRAVFCGRSDCRQQHAGDRR